MAAPIGQRPSSFRAFGPALPEFCDAVWQGFERIVGQQQGGEAVQARQGGPQAVIRTPMVSPKCP